MSNGASKEYKFGQKNNWRRWAWNQIGERVGRDKKNAVVLYLAGKDDLDRPEAIRRGFRSENLIAVERDPSALHSIRSRGALCIESDGFNALLAWPEGRPVAAVHFDLCAGLNADQVQVLQATMFKRIDFRHTVWSFNLLRGREFGYHNELRSQIASMCRDSNFHSKHRGNLLFIALVQEYLASHGLVGKDPKKGEELDRLVSVGTAITDNADARINSYKSDVGQVFDSIVFSSLTSHLPVRDNWDERKARQAIVRASRKNVTRNVAAVLAHRTMMINRVGPYAEGRAA